MPPKRTNARRANKTQQGKGPGLDKFKRGVKKAWNFVKDKKLISKGLNFVAPMLGEYSGIAKTTAGIAEQLGTGVTLPGGSIRGSGRHHHKHMRGFLGAKHIHGSGLLLAGERRPRIITLPVEQSGSGIIGNRVY